MGRVALIRWHNSGRISTSRKDCHYRGGGKPPLWLEPPSGCRRKPSFGVYNLQLSSNQIHMGKNPQPKCEQGEEGGNLAHWWTTPPGSQARVQLRVQEGKSMQRENLCTKHQTPSFPHHKSPPARPEELSTCPVPLVGRKDKGCP